jgi:hypothetical protein
LSRDIKGSIIDCTHPRRTKYFGYCYFRPIAPFFLLFLVPPITDTCNVCDDCHLQPTTVDYRHRHGSICTHRVCDLGRASCAFIGMRRQVDRSFFVCLFLATRTPQETPARATAPSLFCFCFDPRWRLATPAAIKTKQHRSSPRSSRIPLRSSPRPGLLLLLLVVRLRLPG